MNTFDELRKIIGEKKTTEVCEKMAGQVVRIRRRPDSVKVAAASDMKALLREKPEALAKRLGCSARYVKRLRASLKPRRGVAAR